MKRTLCIFAMPLLLAITFFSCNDDSLGDRVSPELVGEVDVRSSNFNFTAQLSGDNEMPPNESNATGQCIVKIAKDEQSISYKLIVSNAENVLASHFHIAPVGVNGPVVAFLYSGGLVEQQNGILAEGTITAANVIGPLAGDLSALIDAIRNGMIYVNVHTVQIPSGEIRGQVD